MKAFACVLAVSMTVALAQRRQVDRGYGAPPPSQPSQPQYGIQTSASTLSQSQHSGDHQGLDWLLESVPGQPGTDYPIYSQTELGRFGFDCNGNVEGGYYADPASQCQAFHVCIPDGLGGLGTQSFLCPNGTIFNQEYFICDWWFNFDCSQAQGLYSRNDEVAAEREAASLAQSSNVRNTYVQPQQQAQRPARPARPAQAQYGGF